MSKLVCLTFYGVVFGLFGWGLGCYFRPSADRTPLGLRLIKLLGLAGVIAQVAGICRTPAHPPVRFLLASGVLAVAAAIFLATRHAHRADAPALAFAGVAPSHIVISGPYRWVRHPFYLSYLIGWLGGSAGAAPLWCVLPFFAMVPIYYIAARQEERRILHGPLRESYERYCAHTGMFLPRLTNGFRSALS